MKILLGDFNEKVGRNTFEPTIRNESVQEISMIMGFK